MLTVRLLAALVLHASVFVWHLNAKSDLPIPRFAVLRAKVVNIHVGPGNQYPISWQFLRQGMPVEIIAEFDTWRQVRFFDGTKGWVHKSLLSGKRSILIHGQQSAILLSEPKDNARIVAYLKPGVLGRLKHCEHGYCYVKIKDYGGWLKRPSLWGLYPHEVKFN